MRLETKRLVLREWKTSDTDDLVGGLNDLAVSRWLAFAPYPYTRRHAQLWMEQCRKSAALGKARRSFDFAIELKAEARVIGGISLVRIDRIHGTAGGGIWLNADYHGQGFGSEALAEKIRFAFQDLKLRRLENGYFKGNRASSRMHRKLGYRVEGLKRAAFRSMADGKLKDEYITALLKKDWIKG